METKNTWGHWRVSDERKTDGNVYVEDSLGVVAIATDPEQASLIAAAPELLDVCRLVAKSIADPNGKESDFSDALFRVIAKATS